MVVTGIIRSQRELEVSLERRRLCWDEKEKYSEMQKEKIKRGTQEWEEEWPGAGLNMAPYGFQSTLHCDLGVSRNH